jgi:hypothetical protein
MRERCPECGREFVCEPDCPTRFYNCTLCHDTGTIMVRYPGQGHEDDLAEYEWCDCVLMRLGKGML